MLSLSSQNNDIGLIQIDPMMKIKSQIKKNKQNMYIYINGKFKNFQSEKIFLLYYDQ